MKIYIYMNENLHKKNYKKLPCVRVQYGQTYIDCYKFAYYSYLDSKTGLLKAAKKNHVKAWLECYDPGALLLYMKPRSKHVWYFNEVLNGTHLK